MTVTQMLCQTTSFLYRPEKQWTCLELGIMFHVGCAPRLTGGVTAMHLQPEEHDPHMLHTYTYTFLLPDIL